MIARRTRLAQLALATSLLTGCGAAPAGTDAGPRADGSPMPIFCGAEPVFMGAPTEALEVGTLRDGTFTAWTSGQELPFAWGLQGGTMIVPTVRAPSTIDPPGAGCVLVEIENLEPGGGTVFEDFRAMQLLLEAAPAGGALEVADLFDQLGWIEIPRGTPLTFDVTVRGTRAAAHTRLELTIVPPGDPLPTHCEMLPTRGEGCRYRQIPATGTVTAIRPAAEGALECPARSSAPMVVEYELAIDAAYRDCTSATTLSLELSLPTGAGTFAIPEACLAPAGLAVGSTFAATYDESFAGTCSPYMVATHAFDTYPCTTECGVP